MKKLIESIKEVCPPFVFFASKKGTTSMRKMDFYSCTALTSVYILDSVTSIGNIAFKDCSALKVITYKNTVEYVGKSN